ncbi:hypothetical protein GCM10009576_098740 [Streptomyces rhizosphaericus]|uniref:Uncharacterized protein n=1 Tax=Streptomyces rhizosphaericus TaxID=114699 RepID=A0ABN1SVZ0_9ACTN
MWAASWPTPPVIHSAFSRASSAAARRQRDPPDQHPEKPKRHIPLIGGDCPASERTASRDPIPHWIGSFDEQPAELLTMMGPQGERAEVAVSRT